VTPARWYTNSGVTSKRCHRFTNIILLIYYENLYHIHSITQINNIFHYLFITCQTLQDETIAQLGVLCRNGGHLSACALCMVNLTRLLLGYDNMLEIKLIYFGLLLTMQAIDPNNYNNVWHVSFCCIEIGNFPEHTIHLVKHHLS
jgi:hypothetical protein